MAFPNIVAHGIGHALTDVIRPALAISSSIVSSSAPYQYPTVEMALHAANRGQVDEAALPELCLLHGVQIAPGLDTQLQGQPGVDSTLKRAWNKIYYALQEQPTVNETFEIANRWSWDDQQVSAQLRKLGYQSDNNRKLLSNLRFDIPGPSDLVRFSVRHCWEPDLLARLGYNDEFPGAIIDMWHAMKGLDYPLLSGPFKAQVTKFLGGPTKAEDLLFKYITLTGNEPTWARFYWYSHWVLPSPSQGYLMWQRLNPARNPRWDGPEMRGINFSYSDLELLLRANDYPPYYRGKLAAISRPIPGIRYARQFATNGVYNWRDLFDWTQRQGYSEGDGIDIADSIWADAQKAAEKRATCGPCKAILDAYRVGILTRDDALANITAQDVPQAQAEALVDQAEIEINVKDSREVVAAVRRQFLLGGLNDVQARQLLLNYGLVMSRIDQYLLAWTVERQFKYKEVSAGKLVSWACKGLLDVDTLDARLSNLGYDAFDRAGLVAEATYCAAELAARAAAKIAQQSKQAQRDLERAQKQAAQAYKDLAQMMAGRASPKDLRKWFCEGKVGETEVYYRLRHLGWPDEDINNLIGDCKSGKGGKQPSGGGP